MDASYMMNVPLLFETPCISDYLEVLRSNLSAKKCLKAPKCFQVWWAYVHKFWKFCDGDCKIYHNNVDRYVHIYEGNNIVVVRFHIVYVCVLVLALHDKVIYY